MLEENKFDEAYAIFEEISDNKAVLELENYKSLRNEIRSLINETINKKKVFIDEQEREIRGRDKLGQ